MQINQVSNCGQFIEIVKSELLISVNFVITTVCIVYASDVLSYIPEINSQKANIKLTLKKSFIDTCANWLHLI